ncbi:MAG: NADH:flavin oxidoreductase [Candidatus Methanoperedens sp.]|nr:NADH:flavin oxidoreductase [Candidatus Methanoperedens sp.]
MKPFQLLFTPLNVGNLVLKNRITLAPMFLCYGNSDGTVSEKTIEFYERRAKAGVSLLVVEASAVDPGGIGLTRMIRVDSDNYIKGLSLLAKAIKDAGGYAVLQLYHGGRYSQQPIAPSPVETYLAPEKKIIPRAMSIDDITELITKFGEAAERAKVAGFDGVELHGASGYLLTQFISPRTNKRTDKYGGSFENRIRFPLELVASIREHAGKEFLLGYRFLSDEWLPDGFTLNEGKMLAARLEEAGVNYLSCNAGTYESRSIPEIIKRTSKKGYQVDITYEIKKEVKIPVFVNGRINTPELAEKIIRKGKADAVALARPLFADPEFVQKIFDDRTDQIIECTNDMLCGRQIVQGIDAVCSQWKKR